MTLATVIGFTNVGVDRVFVMLSEEVNPLTGLLYLGSLTSA